MKVLPPVGLMVMVESEPRVVNLILEASNGTEIDAPLSEMFNLCTPPVVKPRLLEPILKRPVSRSLVKVADGLEADPSAN